MRNPNISKHSKINKGTLHVDYCGPNDLGVSNYSKKTSKNDDYVTAKSILNQLFEKRRLLGSENDIKSDFQLESKPHIGKLLKAIKKQQPIHLILPGFPAKSPNRSKTLGPLPDLAEKHALQNLQLLCDKLKTIYEPGAQITICSDGRVFADLICISDKDVTDYGASLKRHHNL